MTIFSLLTRLPVLGPVLRITNAYVYDGDPRSGKHCASPLAYLRALGIEVGLSSLIALVLTPNYLRRMFPSISFDYHVSVKTPGDLITSILPNLLGFGIGVYALIFAIDAGFIRQLRDLLQAPDRTGKFRPGSVLTLNANMAFPLMVLVVTLIVGGVAEVFEKVESLDFSAWALFWLSMIVTLQLVSTLFRLGEAVILQQLDSVERSDDKRL